MTIEEYSRASEIIKKLDILNDTIADLKAIMHNDTAKWLMEVRPYASHSQKRVNHYEMLPEFLEAIYSKTIAEYEALKRELEQI